MADSPENGGEGDAQQPYYSNLYGIHASAPETSYPILGGRATGDTGNNVSPSYESNHRVISSSSPPRSYAERRQPTQAAAESQQEQHEQGFTFHSKNKHCLFCRRILTGDDDPITLLKCSHAYHLVCGRGYLDLGRGKECPEHECQQEAKRNQYYYEEDGDFIPLDTGDNPEIRKKLEERFGTAGEVSEDPNRTVEAYEDSYMRTNPTKDVNAIARTKLLNKRIAWAGKVTYRELIDGEKTIDDLYEAKLDLLDIYFSCGVTKWDELWQLGVSADDVLTREKVSNLDNMMVSTFGNKEKVPYFMPIRQLVDLYGVDYQNLLDLEITGDDLATALRLDAEDMNDLQITWQVLREDFGVKDKESFADFNFGPKIWISLGFQKSDLYALKITHVQDILDVWPKNVERTAKAFGFTEWDQKSFKIDEYLSNNNNDDDDGGGRRTRNGRRPPPSSGGARGRRGRGSLSSSSSSSSRGTRTAPPEVRPRPSRSPVPIRELNPGNRKPGRNGH